MYQIRFPKSALGGPLSLDVPSKLPRPKELPNAILSHPQHISNFVVAFFVMNLQEEEVGLLSRERVCAYG